MDTKFSYTAMLADTNGKNVKLTSTITPEVHARTVNTSILGRVIVRVIVASKKEKRFFFFGSNNYPNNYPPQNAGIYYTRVHFGGNC